MTQDEIDSLRSQIAELEERDIDFARKSNLLLDELIVTREQIAENVKAIAADDIVALTIPSARQAYKSRLKSISRQAFRRFFKTLNVSIVSALVAVLRGELFTYVSGCSLSQFNAFWVTPRV